ncbi:MAG TPA: CpsB/CapC family capsule biosynthesis tyrosine phosphatase [Candidatus Acidoferrum sp.]|nr:CpsB/CapC family capsule biosynthesis tyrosine phosphatase [Candidatus Acidoferrum sp.]
MVDIHCHILSGMDDGAETFAVSLAMAEMAMADGITHVVATPHASGEFHFDYDTVKQSAQKLQEAVGDKLKIATGCDFHLSPENVSAFRKMPTSFCIHQKDYLLVEFNNFSIPPAMDQTLYEIQLSGVRPIITHPERNPILRAQPQRLEQWIRNGCYSQVTGGSLTGVFGSNSLQTSMGWIARGLVHFVASDAHNTTTRPQKLRAAYEVVQQEFGRAKAEVLFVQNPQAAFDGAPLPYVPEISGEKKKRFGFF